MILTNFIPQNSFMLMIYKFIISIVRVAKSLMPYLVSFSELTQGQY